MFGWYEMVGERISPQKIGKVRVNTFYETRKKPLWLVALKVVGSLAMCAVGFAMLLPLLPLPRWQAAVAVSGVLLIYVGIAFFVRPEPHEDNMGYLGGFVNDPMQYSDNINRSLWQTHCMLGPGRFIAATILDCCTLIGLMAEVSEEQHLAECEARDRAAMDADLQQLRQRVMQRLADREAQGLQGRQVLTSARLLDPEQTSR